MRKVPREYTDMINTDTDNLVGTAVIPNEDVRENWRKWWETNKNMVQWTSISLSFIFCCRRPPKMLTNPHRLTS